MPATQLTIYSRPGCHLCDEMKQVVASVAERFELAITEINIDTDPELEKMYGWEIPVLLIEGVKIAKYRISEEQLTRALAGRAG
ncbi:MAG TPA: glutaredoxin family protein [Vicinamibacterales bacterium]|nr:glutaredoxin family protein [Vicinamibacterales bacterium]